jgi:nucleoid DNA-binding protein
MSLIDDIGNIFLHVSEIIDAVESTITDSRVLAENVRAEVRKIKQFKINPKWKNRVINAPKAVQQTHDFISDIAGQLSDAFHTFAQDVTALKNLRGQIKTGGGEGGGGGVVALLDTLREMKDYVLVVDELFKQLNEFVDALRRIQDELEGFDTLFLQQGNTRKVETLTTGEKIVIRVGNLHS